MDNRVAELSPLGRRIERALRRHDDVAETMLGRDKLADQNPDQ